MNNQKCRVRPEVIHINKESIFYPYSILVNKCSSSCNSINNPYAKLCVPDVVKSINVKVFNLMSRSNETRHIGWFETCSCKCRLDIDVCNNKQRWNEDKFRCEFKELVEKGIRDKGLIWNPSICECKCDKSCDIRQYLDYENRKCRKKLIDKLAEEFSENIDENEMIYNATLNDYENGCGPCTIYTVLFVIAFLITIGISSAFIYFHWY